MSLGRPRHRKLIVSRTFQIKYATILAAIGFTFCLIIGAAVLLYARDTYDVLVSEGLVNNPTILEELNNLQRRLFWKFFVCAVLTVGASFLTGLFVTRRFVGPIKGMERELKKLLAGNLSGHLVLRSTDEFRTLAETFNMAMQQLRDEVQQDLSYLTRWSDQLKLPSKSLEITEEMNHHAEGKRKRTQLLP
jgi:methyl-accepting chemotaxis protein